VTSKFIISRKATSSAENSGNPNVNPSDGQCSNYSAPIRPLAGTWGGGSSLPLPPSPTGKIFPLSVLGFGFWSCRILRHFISSLRLCYPLRITFNFLTLELCEVTYSLTRLPEDTRRNNHAHCTEVRWWLVSHEGEAWHLCHAVTCRVSMRQIQTPVIHRAVVSHRSTNSSRVCRW